MPTVPANIHAFDFFYKWVPTGSLQLTNATWSQHTVNLSSPANVNMYNSWYGFGPYATSVLTRHTTSLSPSAGALPWGCAANDMLWNVLTPSMSVSESTQILSLFGGGFFYEKSTFYRFAYTSESFYYREYGGLVGTKSIPTTSSWIAYEPKMIQYASGSGVGVGFLASNNSISNNPFPSTITAAHAYSLPSAFVAPTNTAVGQNPDMLTYGSAGIGANDGRFFDLAGGCGITRTNISASLVQYEANKALTSTNGRQQVATSLKNRRLFFPTVYTGSTSTAALPTYMFEALTGRPSNQYFTENGGIYNVTFTIKRDITNGYYPDSGIGSELLVYIHNVNTIAPAPSGRVAGANGWYPPEANIVRIKNTPAMSFANPATGYLIETFNINVVQYGFPAQLVFEASGSLSSGNYFGCIIDDVQFCKIGVTTDPALIKPTTVGGVIRDTLTPAGAIG